MGLELNHKCQICGKKYYACNKCDEIHSWRQVSCSFDCYQIYMILTLLRLKKIDKCEAINNFKDVGITIKTIDNFNIFDNVKKQILNIIKTEQLNGKPIDTNELNQEIQEQETPTKKKSKSSKKHK